MSIPVRPLPIAVVAALLAGAAGVLGYVLLLPSFIERTASGMVEPRWLLPATAAVALVLSGFLAQRVLTAGSTRESQLVPSAALGVSIGVLHNLGWSARLLLMDAQLAALAHGWSFIPLVAAISGTLLGHVLHRNQAL